jgi:hypothetical protein
VGPGDRADRQVDNDQRADSDRQAEQTTDDSETVVSPPNPRPGIGKTLGASIAVEKVTAGGHVLTLRCLETKGLVSSA